MAEEFLIDNLNGEMENFMMAKARNIAHISRPLVFNWECKNRSMIIDSVDQRYSIQMVYLQSFKQILSDRSYKYVRLQNWQFELQFNGKQCGRIVLVSDHVVFLANKTNKKQIRDCTFKITVAEKNQVLKLSTNIKGYLNRIGKKNIINQSNNISQEFYSLITFINRSQTRPIEPIMQLNQPQQQQQDALQSLNGQGRKLLQKLRNFINKQEITNFMMDQELSRQGQEKIRRLIRTDSIDKKRKYPKNVQESMLKHLNE